MAAAKILGVSEESRGDGLGNAVMQRFERSAEKIVENGTCIGTRNAVDRIEVEVEIGTTEESGDAREIENALQNPNVVLRGRDDLHHERMIRHCVGQRCDLIDGDFGKLRHLQLADLQRFRVDAVRDVLGGSGSVLAVEPAVDMNNETYFTPKSALRPPGLWLAVRMKPP